MSWWTTGVVAFAAGAIYDALNVGFMHASEKGRPVAAGLYSTLVGGCALTGFWEAIHNPKAIPFLMAGYFVGSYGAVWWKRRQMRAAAWSAVERLAEGEEADERLGELFRQHGPKPGPKRPLPKGKN